MTTAMQSPKPTLGAIAKATGLALVIAVVLNIVLYYVASFMQALPALSTMQQLITLGPVLTFTAGATIAGGIVYFVLTRFLEYESANRWFLILASIVLIGMAITPITNVVDATVPTVLMLEIMHLAAGLPVMYFLIRTAE